MNKKFISGLYGVLAFLAAEGIQILVASIIGVVYVFLYTQGEGRGIEPNILYLISIIASLVCGVAFAIWYFGAQSMGMKEDRKARFSLFVTRHNILRFFVLGVGCQFFTSGAMGLIQSYFPKTFEQYSKVLETLTSGSLGLVILFAVVIAPIVEELIFRGVIMHLVGKGNALIIANVFQALLFGIYHGNIVQGIYGAGLGILLGYTMIKTRTIAAPILLHMIINASSFLVTIFPSNTVGLLLMTVIGGAFFVLGVREIKRM